MKNLTIRGSVWTLGGYGISQVLRLASHLILAWLLTPEIFGLMALVGVFMQGLTMFSDIGIGPSIIQNKRGSDSIFLNTAWTIQIIRGFGLWLGSCVIALPVARWYAQSDPAAWQLSYLLPVAALASVVAGLNSTALFTLNKELRFGRITVIELITQVIGLAVMIGWAWVHPTVWAMIAGGLAAALAKMALSHFLIPGHRVGLAWDRDCRRELFRFGKWIFLSTAFTFLSGNLDKLALGRLLTLSELGLYSIALVFAQIAIEVASRLGSSVMFPVYAKFQDQSVRLMAVALRTREVVLWAGAAMCICTATGSPLFFETLWDPRYHKAGVIAQWLAVYVWARILLQTMDRIPLALGNSRALFFANIIQTGGLLTAMAGYLSAGLPGFIMGLAVGPVAAHLFLLNRLPARSVAMFWQSARFTAMALLGGMLAVGFTMWIRTVSAKPVWVASVVLCAGIPLLLAAWVGYQRIFHDGSRNEAHA